MLPFFKLNCAQRFAYWSCLGVWNGSLVPR